MRKIASFIFASLFFVSGAFAQVAQGVAPFASGNVGSHFLPVGPAPIPSGGCSGAGASLSANANDSNGTVTGTTAANTTCTLTFANAYTVAPDCSATGITSALLTMTVTTTTLVVTYASTATFKWSYICLGK